MEWQTAEHLIAYPMAVAAMRTRVASIQNGKSQELIWLLEHPPIYTAGSSAKPTDLIGSMGFPVHPSGRGGQYTYHGPGQRIGYIMLDLTRRGQDLRLYVRQLESWMIATLAEFGVEGFMREGRVGVWVMAPKGESKIAAIGVRAEKWVTSHGISINLDPDLSHYNGIVPCGISQYGVTSLAELGVDASMADLDAALKKTCPF